MFVIKDHIINEIEIKKSKFICLLYNIDNINLVDKLLKKAKEEYKNANHYCYAYNIENIMKCSDDKEPANTAGLPMLDIIKLKNINNILVIVVRYFGGIKLGATNLTRAYRKSITEAINKTELIPYKKYITKTITLSLDMSNKLNNLEKKYQLINKKYTNNIVATFKIQQDKLNDFIKETRI